MISERDHLIKERAELVARVEAIKRDFRSGLSADSAERAIELENADVLSEIQRVSLERIAWIDERLRTLAG